MTAQASLASTHFKQTWPSKSMQERTWHIACSTACSPSTPGSCRPGQNVRPAPFPNEHVEHLRSRRMCHIHVYKLICILMERYVYLCAIHVNLHFFMPLDQFQLDFAGSPRDVGPSFWATPSIQREPASRTIMWWKQLLTLASLWPCLRLRDALSQELSLCERPHLTASNFSPYAAMGRCSFGANFLNSQSPE